MKQKRCIGISGLEFEKEERWLNKMAQEAGPAECRVLHLHLEKTEPGQYIIRLAAGQFPGF